MSWRKIKAEYIAGGISQRALAEKYGIPWGTLRKRANQEKWNAKRKNAEKKTEQKVEQRTAEKTAEIVADNATLCEQIKTKLLRRLSDMVDNFPNTNAVEMRERIGTTDYVYRMKDLAAVYNSLSDTIPKGQSADIEDLSPLVDLLK